MALAYPRWITRADGARLVVPDEHQHAAHMNLTVEELRASLEPPVPAVEPPPVEEPQDSAADPLGLFTEPKRNGRKRKAAEE